MKRQLLCRDALDPKSRTELKDNSIGDLQTRKYERKNG